MDPSQVGIDLNDFYLKVSGKEPFNKEAFSVEIDNKEQLGHKRKFISLEEIKKANETQKRA